jgi:hypothetical protein
MVGCPALVYSARIVPGLATKVIVAILAASFLVIGMALVLVAAIMAQRGNPLPNFAGYLVICAVVVCSGGLVLAFANDTTVFLSTLVGALVAVVVTKLEALMKPQRKRAARKKMA